jgi:hypothetical protein
MLRMNEGKETWHRLLNWDRGQAPAERLAAIMLKDEGFQAIDPAHPLGGKDGLKDMICCFNGHKWVGGVYFPRGQQSFNEIKAKFIHDLEGVQKNNANGFAFITNQELRLAERKDLDEIDNQIDVQIYHLERLASYLNTPLSYGVRMEFLDIEMTKEEQLSYFANYERRISKIENALQNVSIGLESYKSIKEKELDDYPRSMDEISAALEELLDKVWLDRHLSLRYRVERGQDAVKKEIWVGALESAQKVIDKYGEDNLGPYSDFEWGMINGKLSALRWVFGDEWDMLDT